MKFYKLGAVMLVLLSWACTQHHQREEVLKAVNKGLVNTNIVSAAGEYPQLIFNLEKGIFEKSQTIIGLPAPFNIGQLTHIKEQNGRPILAVILGSAIPQGTHVEIKTIGMIRFLDQVEVPLIVGVPNEAEIIAPSIEDFQTLLFENDPTKRMLEQWLTYQQFPFPFTSFFWENEQATNQWLTKHQIIN